MLIKLLPTLVALVTAAIGANQDAILAWCAAHPDVTLILSALAMIWGNLHPSPLTPKKENPQ